MRIAIISDIHSNAMALRSVLKDMKRQGVKRIYCLGDVVGYHSQLHETIRILRENGIITIKGNHDMMAVGDLEPDHCGPNARAAMLWTRERLEPGEAAYLRDLDDHLLLESGVLLCHSRLGDPVTHLWRLEQYPPERELIARHYPQVRLCFTGHTHVQRVIGVDAEGRPRDLGRADGPLDHGLFHFVNPGSVGHPRRADYRAAYCILDSGSRRIRFRRVRYAAGRLQADNRRNGVTTPVGEGVLGFLLRRRIRGITGMVR